MNRADILATALETLDTYGFADLTMRRLATSLGVAPGALYWHVANKQTLLLGVAELILDGVAALPTGADWERVVRDWAAGLRSALLAHRDGAELVAAVLALRPPDLHPQAPVEVALTAAGLAEGDAHAAAAALLHYVMGHAVDVQTYEQAVSLGVTEAGHAGDAAARFTYGLDLLVAGLRAELG